jgi:hypothetical protein
VSFVCDVAYLGHSTGPSNSFAFNSYDVNFVNNFTSVDNLNSSCSDNRSQDHDGYHVAPSVGDSAADVIVNFGYDGIGTQVVSHSRVGAFNFASDVVNNVFLDSNFDFGLPY